MKESGLSTLKVLDGTKEKLDATKGVVSQVRKQLKKMSSRMVKLRAIDYQPKEYLKTKHLLLKSCQSRVSQVIESRKQWRNKALVRNIVSKLLKRQLHRAQHPSLFFGCRYKATVRQWACCMMRDGVS